jgi:hypothetical protein
MTKTKFIALVMGSLLADAAAMWLFFAHPVVWTIGITTIALLVLGAVLRKPA